MKRSMRFFIAALFGVSLALTGCAGWNDQGVQDEEYGVSPAYEDEGYTEENEELMRENGGIYEEGTEVPE